jgi:heat shock protein HtpX
VAHIANGDMVTLTLIQGVVNTFVIFIARVVGWLVDSALRRGRRRQRGQVSPTPSPSSSATSSFGILASIIVMYFSRAARVPRRRRRRQLMGTPQPMIAALRRLGGVEAGDLPQNIATAGITDRPGWLALFSSHPPIEVRAGPAFRSRSGTT